MGMWTDIVRRRFCFSVTSNDFSSFSKIAGESPTCSLFSTQVAADVTGAFADFPASRWSHAEFWPAR